MSRKKPPDSGAAARNAPLAHRGDDLVQRQIRLLSNQSQQPLHVLLQRRSAASGRLRFGASGVAPPLQPFHRRTRAQIEVLGGLPSRSSRFDCLDHAFPQIIGIWFWHRLGPQRQISGARFAHRRAHGNPFNSSQPEHALVPAIGAITTIPSFLALLVANAEPCPWSSTNAAIRAAQIVALGGMCGLDFTETQASLESRELWIVNSVPKASVVRSNPRAFIAKLREDWKGYCGQGYLQHSKWMDNSGHE